MSFAALRGLLRVLWKSSLVAAPLLSPSPIVAQVEHHHHDAGPAPQADYSPSAPSSNPFDLGIKLTRADGTVVDLGALRGRPTIMTMFFASCPDVCPLLTQDILRAEGRLSAEEVEKLQVVFVSFDERDDPAVLTDYRNAQGINSARWTVAVAAAADSRKLGDLLGVRYQKLPNGSYSHTAMVDLIGADGTILARVPGPALSSPQFPAAVHAMLAMPNPPKN